MLTFGMDRCNLCIQFLLWGWCGVLHCVCVDLVYRDRDRVYVCHVKSLASGNIFCVSLLQLQRFGLHRD